jgi:methylated-DNA-[protein]-cysteine S-methyltransferase
MKSVFYYEFPIGAMAISEVDGALIGISYKGEADYFDFCVAETPVICNAQVQIAEYFAGARTDFKLNIQMRGTDFQVAVWKALQSIPFGETRTYRQVAEMVGSSKASRAVGMACNRNPFAIVVPCHRVIGSRGSLVGYAGGLPAKGSLLELEKRHVK